MPVVLLPESDPVVMRVSSKHLRLKGILMKRKRHMPPQVVLKVTEDSGVVGGERVAVPLAASN